MASGHWKKIRADTAEAKVKRRKEFDQMITELQGQLVYLGGHLQLHQDGAQVNLHFPAELLMYFPSTGTLKRHGKWKKRVLPNDLMNELDKRFGRRRRGRTRGVRPNSV